MVKRNPPTPLMRTLDFGFALEPSETVSCFNVVSLAFFFLIGLVYSPFFLI